MFHSGAVRQSRLYKILVVGDVHTGKSALIRRYVHDFFSHDYRLGDERNISLNFDVSLQ